MIKTQRKIYFVQTVIKQQDDMHIYDSDWDQRMHVNNINLNIWIVLNYSQII